MAEGRAEGRMEGMAEGRAEGKAEGEQSEKRRTAKQLFTEGMDISFVSRITGLSVSDLSALQ
jgi:predicted transposase/invertase (TIGR01784 family)